MLIYHLDFNYVHRSLDTVRTLLKQASEFGFQAVLWEMEDQIRWQSCPEIATKDSWSKDDFRDLLAYSRSLGLEPIPLLQTMGHAEYVMKHKKYLTFREDPAFSDCYCTSREEVRVFLKNWIQEICNTFGNISFFHLGGDEVFRFGSCPTCKKTPKETLYIEYITDIAQLLLKKKIRPCVWSDMFLETPEMLSKLPNAFQFWYWKYDCGIDYAFPDLPQLLNYGKDVVLCGSIRCWKDSFFVPAAAMHMENIYGMLLCAEKNNLSCCMTSWSIRLNPIALSTPMLEFPAYLKKHPESSFSELKSLLSIHSFGYRNGLNDAILIGDSQPELERFSGTQWTRLKDSSLPPDDYLAELLADDLWVRVCREQLAAAKKNVTNGLAGMRHGTTPLAGLWCKGALLRLQYLDIVESLLDRKFPEGNVIENFRKQCENFFQQEETPGSAAKNASLIVFPWHKK